MAPNFFKVTAKEHLLCCPDDLWVKRVLMLWFLGYNQYIKIKKLSGGLFTCLNFLMKNKKS